MPKKRQFGFRIANFELNRQSAKGEGQSAKSKEVRAKAAGPSKNHYWTGLLVFLQAPDEGRRQFTR